jgi:hypothetical protein
VTESAIVFSPATVERKRDVATGALRAVSELVVNDQASAQGAADWLGDVQTELKAIKAMKDSALRPMRESEQQIRDWFRPIEEALTAAVDVIKAKIGEYELANRQLQREAFTRAADMHDAGDHIAARAEIVVANGHAANRKPSGASTREVWEAEIVDADAVRKHAPEWCDPAEKRIQAMARLTPADSVPVQIPGVRYVRKAVVVGRPRRK